MGSTNKTANLNLSQYVDADKPTYLGDYNRDMKQIDDAYGAVQVIGNDAKASAAAASQAAAQATAAVATGIDAAKVDLRADIATARAGAVVDATSAAAVRAREIAVEVLHGSGAAGGPLAAWEAALSNTAVNARMVVLGSEGAAETIQGKPTQTFIERLAFRSGAKALETLTGGNAGTGMQWFNGAIAGATAANYAPTTAITKAASLAPTLVLHYLGANDWATNVDPGLFENRVRSAIEALEAASPASVHVLATPVRRTDVSGTSPWSAYNNALAKIAAEKPDTRIHIGLGAYLAKRGAAWGMLKSDGITLTRNAHKIIADILADLLGIPTENGIPDEWFIPVPNYPAGGTASVPGAGYVNSISAMDLPPAPYPRLVRVDGVLEVGATSGAGLQLKAYLVDNGAGGGAIGDGATIINIPARASGVAAQPYSVGTHLEIPAGKTYGVRFTLYNNSQTAITVTMTPDARFSKAEFTVTPN